MAIEQHIDCCEWCGRDTAPWGRFLLQGGPGLKIVLCGPCAQTAEFNCAYGDDQYGEIVADTEVIRR